VSPKYGEEHENTIYAGIAYSDLLLNANRGDEARELLMKLLATSRHHNISKDIELALWCIN